MEDIGTFRKTDLDTGLERGCSSSLITHPPHECPPMPLFLLTLLSAFAEFTRIEQRELRRQQSVFRDLVEKRRLHRAIGHRVDCGQNSRDAVRVLLLKVIGSAHVT